MGTNTAIDWTDATWNPVTGCSKASPGCQHCYAETMATRLKAMGQPRYANGFAPTCHPEALGEPLHWKKPRRVFVVSMGDLFHEAVPDEFIDMVWAAMLLSPQHTFQVLTKRPERMRRYLCDPNRAAAVARRAGAMTPAPSALEEMRPIDGYPGYYVSSLGFVYSESGRTACGQCGAPISGYAKRRYCSKKCKDLASYHRRQNGREIPPGMSRLEPEVGEQGHRRVMLYRDGVGVRHLVHRMVLTAFSRPPVNDEQGRHLDGDPSHNHVGNLCWGSPADNRADRNNHGAGRSFHKLEPDQVAELRRLRKDGDSVAALAAFFAVSETTVRAIVAGDTWAPPPDAPAVPWPLPNVLVGVTAEDQARADERIPLLLQTPAAVRFVSVEPMLAPVDLSPFLVDDLYRMGRAPRMEIDWVIAGCESGPKRRPADLGWFRDLRDQCVAASVPYFLKQAQIGGGLVKMPILDGKVWADSPARDGGAA